MTTLQPSAWLLHRPLYILLLLLRLDKLSGIAQGVPKLLMLCFWIIWLLVISSLEQHRNYVDIYFVFRGFWNPTWLKILSWYVKPDTYRTWCKKYLENFKVPLKGQHKCSEMVSFLKLELSHAGANLPPLWSAHSGRPGAAGAAGSSPAPASHLWGEPPRSASPASLVQSGTYYFELRCCHVPQLANLMICYQIRMMSGCENIYELLYYLSIYELLVCCF